MVNKTDPPEESQEKIDQRRPVETPKALETLAAVEDTDPPAALGPDVVREVGEILSSVKVLKKKLVDTESHNAELRVEIAKLIARQRSMDAEMADLSAAARAQQRIETVETVETVRPSVEVALPAIDLPAIALPSAAAPLSELSSDERAYLLAQLKEEQQRHLARAKAFDQAVQEASRREQRLRDEIEQLKDWHDQREINNAERDLTLQQQSVELQQAEVRNQMLVQQLAFYEREQGTIGQLPVDLEKIRGRLRDVITSE